MLGIVTCTSLLPQHACPLRHDTRVPSAVMCVSPPLRHAPRAALALHSPAAPRALLPFPAIPMGSPNPECQMVSIWLLPCPGIPYSCHFKASRKRLIRREVALWARSIRAPVPRQDLGLVAEHGMFCTTRGFAPSFHPPIHPQHCSNEWFAVWERLLHYVRTPTCLCHPKLATTHPPARPDLSSQAPACHCPAGTSSHPSLGEHRAGQGRATAAP